MVDQPPPLMKKQREYSSRALLHPVCFLLFGSIKDHLVGLVTSPLWMIRYGLPLNFKDRATQLWSSRIGAFITQWISEFSSSSQLWVWENKHRKNCECCPGHYLIVNQYSSMSWFKFCNLSVMVNCVTKSLDRSQSESKSLSHEK